MAFHFRAVCTGTLCALGLSLLSSNTGLRAASNGAAGTLQNDASGNLALRWRGEPGQRYIVETSPDLVNWTPLADTYFGSGDALSAIVRESGVAVEPRRFWRTTASSFLTTSAALNADHPGFASSVYVSPWGAAGASWPEQLFWENVGLFQAKHYEITNGADMAEQAGVAPIIGQVAWGIDLILGNGGDASLGYADFSQRDGYKQYAAWMNPRAADYFALNSAGAIAYPGQGYISFGMPMLPADVPAGEPPQTFGEWAGKRIGQLALDIHCRGIFAADYFIGVNYGVDWHPRLLDSFETWAGVTVPGATAATRHDYIVAHHGPLWLDFLSTMQAGYFVGAGKVLLAAGKTPMLGGQISNNPPIARMGGNDPRLWSKLLPGRCWLFFVETQSAGDRNTPPDWTSLYSIGTTASRSPDVPFGIMLDADNGEFWQAATRAGWSTDFGWRYLKHTWLAAGWAHVANADGTVRRAAQCFMRSYWDAAGTNPDHIGAILGHIPRHPFGPALYYSVNIERSYEEPPTGEDGRNYYYFSEYFQRGIRTNSGTYPKPGFEGVVQGLNLGYWVSDAVDLAKLPAANKPSAWLLYDSDRLPAGERARLETVAPVIDLMSNPAAALAAGPIRTTGAGLNCVAFVDQNGSVIVMVSNMNETAATGTMAFTQVGNGSFTCNGLLGTPSATLTVTANQGSVPVSVAARDSLVFEIPGLHWLGH